MVPAFLLSPALSSSFVAVYRQGGRQACEWRASVPFATRAEALLCAEEIRRGGRKALVKPVRDIQSHGMPEGWGA